MSEPKEGKLAFDVNAEARAHGGYLNLPQGEDESDGSYRERVAGVLRANDQVIEAHEVITGRRYDDPEQGDMGPMTGIIGAMAQELHGHILSPHDPERQIGDDIAYGVVVRAGADRSAQAIGTIFGALGPEVGMDVIETFREKPRSED